MGDELTGEVVQERLQIVREFAIESLHEGDGRTLDLRVIPYNTAARVSDPPRYEPYDEVWLPGCFESLGERGNLAEDVLARLVEGVGLACEDELDR